MARRTVDTLADFAAGLAGPVGAHRGHGWVDGSRAHAEGAWSRLVAMPACVPLAWLARRRRDPFTLRTGTPGAGCIHATTAR